MRKNILFIFSIVLGLTVGFASCSDDDSSTYDEEWKLYNDSIYNATRSISDYERWSSESGNGEVLMKRYKDNDETNPFKSFTEIEDEYPLFSDSVVCRYVGWFFLKDGTPYFFDGTENKCTVNDKEYTLTYNKKQGIGFRVSQVIDGWSTALQNMKAGDEVRICMPYLLGYGASGTSDNYGNTLIPAYTTLWFDVKLVKVIRND